MIVSYKDNTTK